MVLVLRSDSAPTEVAVPPGFSLTQAEKGEMVDPFLATLMVEQEVTPQESYAIEHSDNGMKQATVVYASSYDFETIHILYWSYLHDNILAKITEEEIRPGLISMYFQKGADDAHVVLEDSLDGVTVTVTHLWGVRE